MPDSNRRRLPLVIALAVLGSGLLLTVGYVVFQRLDSLQQEVVGLNRQLEEASQQSQEALRKSEDAQTRASAAEKRSWQAVEGRAVAESAQARAEMAADQARQEAQSADQDAQRARVEAQTARREADQIRREREEELNRLQQALGQLVETRRTALGLVMNLDDRSIQFDFDKATLRPQNRELLSRIAGVLLTSQGYRVQVYGHTDDIGSEEYNRGLSEQRAQAVRDYMVEAGIDPGIIGTKGFGKSNPLVPASTPQARQKNRRVEIGIVDTMINYRKTVSSEESRN